MRGQYRLIYNFNTGHTKHDAYKYMTYTKQKFIISVQ